MPFESGLRPQAAYSSRDTSTHPPAGISGKLSLHWTNFCLIKTSIQIFPVHLLSSSSSSSNGDIMDSNAALSSSMYDNSTISRFSTYQSNTHVNSFLQQFVNDVFVSSRDLSIDAYVTQLSNNCIAAIKKVYHTIPYHSKPL